MRTKDILPVLLLFSALAHGEVTTFSIIPSATDPDIRTFNSPHGVYVDRDIVVEHKADLPKDRHELVVWIPGTRGNGRGPQGFLNLAANLGYHVVSLMYPDAISASACAEDTDPHSFERFRMAIIRGGQTVYQRGHKEISIDRSECIENRLIRLLQFLEQKRPRENWSQFLNEDDSIKWESIVVAGQSQGGGHAALIGIKHRVARVICFGAPKDYSNSVDAPAAWYNTRSATPKPCFFAFNHHQDPQGCTPKQLLKNLNALGLDAFGFPAEVDSEPFPYHHTKILFTSYPVVTVNGAGSEGAVIAHGSAINSKNADRWNQVWTYMLTEKIP